MNHDCSTKAVFLCTAVKLQSCHILALGLVHLSISIHLRISFSCFMKFFLIENNPWAGLGRILRNQKKTRRSSVHLCLFLWEGFPRQTCINQVGKTSLFHKGCVSVHSCQTAILPHLGTLNSACWAFSTFQSAFI